MFKTSENNVKVDVNTHNSTPKLNTYVATNNFSHIIKPNAQCKIKLDTLPKFTETENEIKTEETGNTEQTSKKDFVRIIVHLRKNRSFSYEPANFSICLFDYFEFEIDKPGFVECYMKNNIVFLQLPQRERYGRKNNKEEKNMIYRLEHPIFCAAHRLSEMQREKLPKEFLQRGMDVGVSVILESSDSRVLVTRRAYHMRTFPGVWVPPGGHIEEGETFKDAGFREVFEETGLNLKDVEVEVLGVWESVFPSVLYEGEPRRHHLVVYLHVLLQKSSKELQKLLQLDPSEVDASMWISKDVVSFAIEGGIPGLNIKRLYIPLMQVHSDGSYSNGLLDPVVLRKKMPAKGRIVERLTTGTRQTLSMANFREGTYTLTWNPNHHAAARVGLEPPYSSSRRPKYALKLWLSRKEEKNGYRQ